MIAAVWESFGSRAMRKLYLCSLLLDNGPHNSRMLHRYARTTECIQALHRYRRGKRRQLHGTARRRDRLSGPEWLWQIDHDEDDCRPARPELRQDSLRRRTHPTRPDRLQAAHGLRARGTAPVRPPQWVGVPGDDRAAAAPALQANRGAHRWTAEAALAPRRPSRADLGLLERYAPEGPACRRLDAQSRSHSAGRTFFRARYRLRARVAEPDSGTRSARQSGAVQLPRTRYRGARLLSCGDSASGQSRRG